MIKRESAKKKGHTKMNKQPEQSYQDSQVGDSLGDSWASLLGPKSPEIPEYELSFEERKKAGTLPEGVRDEQNYEKYREEVRAHTKEAIDQGLQASAEEVNENIDGYQKWLENNKDREQSNDAMGIYDGERNINDKTGKERTFSTMDLYPRMGTESNEEYGKRLKENSDLDVISKIIPERSVNESRESQLSIASALNHGYRREEGETKEQYQERISNALEDGSALGRIIDLVKASPNLLKKRQDVIAPTEEWLKGEFLDIEDMATRKNDPISEEKAKAFRRESTVKAIKKVLIPMSWKEQLHDLMNKDARMRQASAEKPEESPKPENNPPVENVEEPSEPENNPPVETINEPSEPENDSPTETIENPDTKFRFSEEQGKTIEEHLKNMTTEELVESIKALTGIVQGVEEEKIELNEAMSNENKHDISLWEYLKEKRNDYARRFNKILLQLLGKNQEEQPTLAGNQEPAAPQEDSNEHFGSEDFSNELSPEKIEEKWNMLSREQKQQLMKDIDDEQKFQKYENGLAIRNWIINNPDKATLY